MYGDLKVRNLIWNTGSGDNTVVLSTLATQSYVTTNFAPKANPTFTGTINGADLILSGNLTVNGTQTIINTQTLDVEDKQIEIGKVSSPSDTTANEGGWKLKGASDKTFLWYDSTDAWTSSEHIHVPDNKQLILGTASNFRIHYNGTDNRLDSYGKNLDLINKNTDGAVYEKMISCIPNGAVELFHNNVKTLATQANGITVLGPEGGPAQINLYSDEGDDNADLWRIDNKNDGILAIEDYSGGSWVTRFRVKQDGKVQIPNDTGKYECGSSGDLSFYHDGNHSRITNNTGQLHIKNVSTYSYFDTDGLYVRSSNGSQGIISANLTSVDLYYSGTKRLETTSSGINVTGAISVNGSPLSASPEIDITASGAISNNQAVIVNSSGQAVAVTQTNAVASPPTTSFAGTIVGDTSNMDSFSDCTYDEATDRYVQVNAYNSNGGYYVYVGQMVNGTMSWGSRSSSLGFSQACRECKIQSNGDGKILVIGHVWANSGQTVMLCGTINASAKTVTFGSPYNTGTAGTSGSYLCKPVWTSSTTAIQIRRDSQNSNNFRISPYTMTGTSIQQHSQSNLGTGDGSPCIAYRNNKIVIGVRDNSNKLSVRFAYMSNSNQTINWGAWSTKSGSYFVNVVSVAWVNDTTAVFTFRDNTASKGTSVAFTIGSGSTDNTVTSTGSFQYYEPNAEGNTPFLYFDSDISRLVCTYRKQISSKMSAITVLGNYTGSNSVTWDTSNTCTSRNTTNDSVIREGFASLNDTTNDRCVIMAPGGSGSNTTNDYSAFIVETEVVTTNMTDGNFLGFSSAAYSNGQTATINIVGNTTTKSSLTAGSKYYVKKDGTLSTTADSPSVEAGLALSSTKLLIKG